MAKAPIGTTRKTGEKCPESGVWKAQIYFNYQLYSYPYPFLFPKSYLSYQDKYDMQIKLQIMQSFANTSLKKKFNVSEFLGTNFLEFLDCV